VQGALVFNLGLKAAPFQVVKMAVHTERHHITVVEATASCIQTLYSHPADCNHAFSWSRIQL